MPPVPWIEEERGEIGEGLIHLDFAALRRGVGRAATAQDVNAAKDVLSFVEELVERLHSLHPEVVDALDVSFLEDLYLSKPRERDFAAHLLLPKTRVRWNEIVAAHEGGSS